MVGAKRSRFVRVQKMCDELECERLARTEVWCFGKESERKGRYFSYILSEPGPAIEICSVHGPSQKEDGQEVIHCGLA